MHPGLRTLLRLRIRAALRGVRRNLGSPTRVVVFVFGALLVALWAGSLLFAGVAGQQTQSEWFEDAMPFFILIMLVLSITTSAGERAIYFSPSEIDFLFAAPFSRRQLLAYKLIGSFAQTTFSAVIFSVILMRNVPSWHSAFLGAWLALAFVQFAGMAVLLASQTLAEAAVTRVRKAVLGLTVAVIVYFVWSGAASVGDGTAAEVLASLREKTVLKYLVWPLEPFVRVTFAEPFWPEGAMWSGVCVGMIAAICAFIFWLDAEYRESAIAVSQRWYARIQSARKTGLAPSGSTKARGRAPRLPYWGGAGPIAWRQLTTAIRNSRSLLMVAGIMAAGIAITMMNKERDEERIWFMLIGVTTWMTILLTMMVRFDFRSDIEQMEGLKALPLPAHRIAVGQLIAPVFVCLILQIAIFAAGAAANGRVEYAAVAALFLVPVNVLLFGVENFVFLLFPSRVSAFNPGDFLSMGRQMLLMFLKFGVFFVAGGFSGLAGVVAYLLMGESWPAALTAAWIVLVCQALLILPGLSWAFNRFDVSADLPA